MAAVRVLREDDVPGAVELFERTYPQHRWASRSDCEGYFREILFGNPWRDAGLPSWVAVEGRRITGLYAIVPRRMQLRGRALRAAVGCQFMVDPGPRRNLVALQLARACLAGPQDLTFADGANDATRRMWRGFGGSVSLLHSLHWTRALRPARYALSLLEQRSARRAPWRAARPFAALADTLAARLHPNSFLRAAPQSADTALGAQEMLAHLPQTLRGAALQPVYGPAGLAWLLEQAARKTRHGALRARAAREDGRLIGWYLYYLEHGGTAEVLQLAAVEGCFGQVLARLLADAWREGASAVHGRLDARYMQELSARHCWFRWDNTWTLVHTRDAQVAAALHEGEAQLSRLEGEWWMRFLDAGGAARAPEAARAPLRAAVAAPHAAAR